MVPRGYPACARVFHPATLPNGQPVRWKDVAEQVEQQMHPLAQWHALVGSANPDDLADSRWSGGPPERGSLPQETWSRLCTILSREVTPDDLLFCAQWTGWASVSAWLASLSIRGDARGIEDPDLPIFSLPPLAGRDYLLLKAPLDKVGEFVRLHPFERLPNMVWPSDRGWFLVSDIDFDSTLIGGSKDLIRSIIESASLEAASVHFADSLASDADTINFHG
jgi:hypothetical protein